MELVLKQMKTEKQREVERLQRIYCNQQNKDLPKRPPPDRWDKLQKSETKGLETLPDLQDTVKENFKKMGFFSGTEAPCLLKDYDAFGFDADECLVKFKTKQITTIMVETHLKELHRDFDYPREILDFDFERNLEVCINATVFDIQHGLILRIGQNKVILSALQGFTPLSQVEITNLFGKEAIYQHLNWPESHRQIEDPKGAHCILMGVYDKYKVAVICQVVELIKKGVIKGKTYLQLFYDLKEAAHRILMESFTEDGNVPISSVPSFQTVFERPQEIIEQQPSVAIALKVLKSAGKQLFIMTDAHILYLELCMRVAIGNDWKQYFNLIITDCRKPLFTRTEQPFHAFDAESETFRKEGVITNGEDLFKNRNTQLFLEGNAVVLTEYLQVCFGREDVRVAYFGADYFNDMFAVYEFNQLLQEQCSPVRWHAIGIVNELGGFDYQLTDNQIKWNTDVWGDSFFQNSFNAKQVQSFFAAQVPKYSRYAMPSLSGLQFILLQKTGPKEIESKTGFQFDKTNLPKCHKYYIEQRTVSQHIILHPPEDHRFSLIWLHGLGGSATGCKDIFSDPRLCRLPEGCRIILPTAKFRPVTLTGGKSMYSWFDIKAPFYPKALQLTDEYFKKTFDQDQLNASVERITKLVDEEAHALGSAKNVFIGGFSQGCAVALATYIRYQKSLGGVCGCSGFHAANINWRAVNKKALTQTPVFISHGNLDQVVNEDYARGTYSRLRENGLSHTEYFLDQGIQHELGPETNQRLIDFFAKHMQLKPQFTDVDRSSGLQKQPKQLADQTKLDGGICLQIQEGKLEDQNIEGIITGCHPLENSQFFVSQEIDQKGGPSIQQELNQKYSHLYKKHHSIPAGMALTTKGGNLASKQVIHIIEPFVSTNDPRVKRSFYRLMVQNSLLAAERDLKLSQVAIPLLSTRNYNEYDPEEACTLIFEGIRMFLDNRAHEKTLEKIKIVEQEWFQVLKKQFDLHYNTAGFLSRSVEEINNDSQYVIAKQIDLQKQKQQRQCSKPDIMLNTKLDQDSTPTHYFSPARKIATTLGRISQHEDKVVLRGGLILHLVKGKLTEQQVDAIANPQFNNLPESASKEQYLEALGGDAIKEPFDCFVAKNLGQMPKTMCFCTSVKAIPANFVIHMLTIVNEYNLTIEKIPDMVYKTVTNILAAADQLELKSKSLGLPAINMTNETTLENLQWLKRLVIEPTMQAVEDFAQKREERRKQTPSKNQLEYIKLVVDDLDKELFLLFQESIKIKYPLQFFKVKDLTGIVKPRQQRLFKIASGRLEAIVSSFGASLVSLKFKGDKMKPAQEMTLCNDDLTDMLNPKKNPYYGATCGRVAGRIDTACFSLPNGNYVNLSANDGPNSLHGGEMGFSRVFWPQVTIIKEEELTITIPTAGGQLSKTKKGSGIRFSRISDDGEDNFLGKLKIDVSYLLTEDDELYLSWKAQLVEGQEKDCQTPINLTNHTYWNLSGDFCESTIRNHYLHLPKCSRYLPIDEVHIPTGEIVSVENTPFDFRCAQKIDDQARLDGAISVSTTDKGTLQDRDNITGKVNKNVSVNGLDHQFLIDGTDPDEFAPTKISFAAELKSKSTKMEVWTTHPSLVVYTSNFLPKSKREKHRQHAAVCLQTCQLNDAVNKIETSGWPKKGSVLQMGQVYQHTTVHKFSSIGEEPKEKEVPEFFNNKFGVVSAVQSIDPIKVVKKLDP